MDRGSRTDDYRLFVTTMIRNYLPLLWKLVFALAVVLLIANFYESVQSGHYDRPRQWLFFALLFTSIIIRFISQKTTKNT